ncbi:hypothetical protein ES703_52139 [subsurface metagenome]
MSGQTDADAQHHIVGYCNRLADFSTAQPGDYFNLILAFFQRYPVAAEESVCLYLCLNTIGGNFCFGMGNGAIDSYRRLPVLFAVSR